ncbi:hypothetical protein [Agrobacterium tumefaciens]|uniref:hypothetical protein n=1 Tax=Agrobacterium tumefaciens TaxID=358 RepID=UPI003B9E0397
MHLSVRDAADRGDIAVGGLAEALVEQQSPFDVKGWDEWFDVMDDALDDVARGAHVDVGSQVAGILLEAVTERYSGGGVNFS